MGKLYELIMKQTLKKQTRWDFIGEIIEKRL